MHYEIRSQTSSSSDPPTTGSSGAPGGYRQKTACQQGPHRATATRPATAWPRERGEVLPSPPTRLADRIRFPCAEACGPRLYIRGSIHDNPGFRRLSAARYPGYTAGPVLQHRPSETLPRLWSEREGLAM